MAIMADLLEELRAAHGVISSRASTYLVAMTFINAVALPVAADGVADLVSAARWVLFAAAVIVAGVTTWTVVSWFVFVDVEAAEITDLAREQQWDADVLDAHLLARHQRAARINAEQMRKAELLVRLSASAAVALILVTMVLRALE